MIKKSFITILLCLIMAAQSGVAAYANSDGISVIVDDKPLQMDALPKIINGRVMVPLKSVMDAIPTRLGGTVGDSLVWDEAEGRVGFTVLDMPVSYEYSMIIGDPVITIIFRSSAGPVTSLETLDYPPVIDEGGVLVSLEFLAETTYSDVGWDPENRTITIYSVEYLYHAYEP